MDTLKTEIKNLVASSEACLEQKLFTEQGLDTSLRWYDSVAASCEELHPKRLNINHEAENNMLFDEINKTILNIREQTLKTMNLNKNDYLSLYNIGASKFKSGDYAGAICVFQILVVLDENNILYLKSLASAFQNQKNFETAIYYYKIAYKNQPQNESDILFYIANCYIELTQLEEALQYLEQFELESSIDNELAKRTTLLKKILKTKISNKTND